jgi:hypothetical protein
MVSTRYPTDARIISLHVEWSFCKPCPKGCRSVLSNRVNRNSSCSGPTLERLRRETGLTIMLVEQNAQAALRLSGRAYVLVNGQVQQSGSSRDLIRDERNREAFLSGGGHAGRPRPHPVPVTSG